MPSERRKAPRFSVRQIVEIGFGRETVLWADAINLSSTGLLCRTSRAVSASSRVLVSMVLPNGARVDGEGVVVRSNEVDGEHQAAIKFTAFHGDGSTGLDRFLRYLGMKPLLASEGQPTQSNRRRSP